MIAGSTMLGRDADLAAVNAHLVAGSVVTVVGPGGIGKTTLVEAIAAAHAEQFDASVTVALTDVDEDDDLVHVLSRQLGHDSVEALHVALVERSTLIVLDNCETAMALARAFVDALMSSPSPVAVLATSRLPLGLAAEQVHVLEPLALPHEPGLVAASESPAVQLFLARARSAGASWEASDVHLEAIAHIVRRLDGMPLAIELAAARARHVGPADLVDLLDRQLDVLKRPADHGPSRHHSIRGAIYGSYDPLDVDTKRLFRHLSLVRSAVDLDFVDRLAAVDDKLATLEILSTLVDHSLVVAADTEGGTMYRLLEPIRAYGLEQLEIMGETQAAEMRFIEAVTGFADDIVLQAMQTMSAEVLDRISHRSSLLLAAIEAALEHDDGPDRAYRLYLPFYAPTPVARIELAAVGARILARWPDQHAPLQAEALAVMAHSSMWAGDDDEARARADRSLAHPEATGLAKLIAHRVHGFTAGLQGNRIEAVEHLEAAIGEAAAFGGTFERELQMSWACMLAAPDRSAEALVMLDSCATKAAVDHEMLALVWASIVSAHHHVALQDFDSAGRAAARALEAAQQTSAPWALCASHRIMASVTALTTGWSASVPSWSHAFETEVQVGDIEGIALTIRTAAAAAEGADEPATAEALWACIPPRRGVTALPPLFADGENALLDRLGAPIPMTITESIIKARALLRADAPSPPVGTVAPTLPIPDVVCFDDFEIDIDAHELRCRGERVHIEPQVFDVLAYLAQRPGRMVSKEELLDEVWGDRFVSASALSSRIKSARAATGDDGKTQAVIRTVHGRGFMFVAEASS